MSDNPYLPPSDLPDSEGDPSFDPPQDVVEPPRYRGTLEIIQGTIEATEAVRMARACKSVLIAQQDGSQYGPSQTTIQLSPLSISLFVIVLAATIAIFSASATPGGGVASPLTMSLDWSLLFLIGFPILILLMILILIVRSKSAFAKADPPIEGETTIRLTTLGMSAHKLARDGRPMEVFCSWRQMHVMEGPDAWLLYIGLVSPVLVVKEWIVDEDQLHPFQALIHDIARWRSSQVAVTQLSEIPEEARESFPTIDENAIPLSCRNSIELTTRRELARELRQRFRAYVGPRSRRLASLVQFVAFIAVAAALNLSMIRQWLSGEIQWQRSSVLLLAVTAIIGFVFLKMKKALTVDQSYSGALTETDLWFDYRMLLIRLPLDSFPERLRLDDCIVVATERGSSTILLPRVFFRNDEDFQSAARQLVPAAARVEHS